MSDGTHSEEPAGLSPVERAVPKSPSDRAVAREPEFGPRDQKLAVYLESRMTSIIRRESRDPYAGLPADDVLDRLHRRFPEVNYPERMMARLEVEQRNRNDLARQSLEVERYEAETSRREIDGYREVQRQTGNRAVGVLVFLVAVGVLCIFTGHEQAGQIVLGTTVVGVVGSFLVQQVRSRK